MRPNARREPGEGLSSDQSLGHDEQIDHDSTAHGLTVDASEVMILEAELRELFDDFSVLPEKAPPSTQAALSDASRMAHVLCETFGPAWCRCLVTELERRVVIDDG